jgi:hypothetical protein
MTQSRAALVKQRLFWAWWSGGCRRSTGHCANLDDDLGGEVGGLGGLLCDPEEGEVGVVVFGEERIT